MFHHDEHMKELNRKAKRVIAGWNAKVAENSTKIPLKRPPISPRHPEYGCFTLNRRGAVGWMTWITRKIRKALTLKGDSPSLLCSI